MKLNQNEIHMQICRLKKNIISIIKKYDLEMFVKSVFNGVVN